VDSFFRPTRVEISLDALRHNLNAFRQVLPDSMRMMAVVKANAYGHGAVEIAEEAVAGGAHCLGVAFLDEAIELRKAGIAAPILVLGYTPPEGIGVAVQHDIAITAYSDNMLEALQTLHSSGSGPRLKVHVKIDTGMGRLGLHEEQAAIAYIEKALKLPGVLVEGLYTHYACADETDKTYTYDQHRRFDRIVRYFMDKGVCFDHLHAGNSATAIDLPELSYNMIRLGISMYGLYPSAEVNRTKVELQPVMSFITGIVMLKRVPPNSGISYGKIYVTEGEEDIATLPVGYADGYTRMLTSKAEVLVRGRKVPVVGKICMDQCMINVTGLADVAVGDEVILFGKQGDRHIFADDLASALGTINYEITCMISNRVPRVYMRNAKVKKIVNHLIHT
jgi:alanine racemase